MSFSKPILFTIAACAFGVSCSAEKSSQRESRVTGAAEQNNSDAVASDDANVEQDAKTIDDGDDGDVDIERSNEPKDTDNPKEADAIAQNGSDKIEIGDAVPFVTTWDDIVKAYPMPASDKVSEAFAAKQNIMGNFSTAPQQCIADSDCPGALYYQTGADFAQKTINLAEFTRISAAFTQIQDLIDESAAIVKSGKAIQKRRRALATLRSISVPKVVPDEGFLNTGDISLFRKEGIRCQLIPIDHYFLFKSCQ